MALWDNFGDQIGKLATAAAINPVADYVMFAPSDGSFGERSTLVNCPWMIDFMLQASGVNTQPTASTTAKDTFQTPQGIYAVELYVQSLAAATGTPPSFDFYNSTSAQSLVDATATASAVLTFVVGGTNVRDSAPDAVAHSAPNEIGLYCVTAPSATIGSTWGHLLFCWA